MRKRKGVLTWLAFIIFLSAGRTALSATTFAHIELVDGIVSIIDDKGQSRIPHVGETIEEGDTIVTGRDGELQARTEDHGLVAVRPNTKMKVQAYRANGDKDDKSGIFLFEGAIRSITGWIGALYPNNYQITTSTAAIAIRGTDHEPSYIPEPGPGEKPIAPPGTYDKVNSGSTVIRNDAGEVVVKPSQVGFAPHDAKSAPHITKSVPQFYRPSRNEDKIEKRKAELEKEIVQRRNERQEHRAQERKERRDHRKSIQHRQRHHSSSPSFSSPSSVK
jgi:hypothetical protein